jgi:hypothetical protein
MASAPRRFHYKVCQLSRVSPGVTLQWLLRNAYNAVPKPWGRVQPIVGLAANSDAPAQPSSGGEGLAAALSQPTVAEKMVISLKANTHKGLTCGVLQRYEPGASVPATVITEDAENWPFRHFSPPKAPGQTAELTKNILFFGVRDNHVILTQETGFGAQHLQQHLQWLFESFNESFAKKEGVVALHDNIPKSYRRDLGAVKKLTLHTVPQVHAAPPQSTLYPTAAEVDEPLSWIIEKDPLIEAFLKIVGQSRAHPLKNEAVMLDKAYKEGSLRASVTLHFTGNKESPLKQAALDVLETTGIPWEMELPRGEPLRSNTAKINRAYSVSLANRLPVPSSAFDIMATMLDDLVKQQEVAADP